MKSQYFHFSKEKKTTTVFQFFKKKKKKATQASSALPVISKFLLPQLSSRRTKGQPSAFPPPVSNVFYALTFAAACTGPRRRAPAPRCHLPPRSVGSVFHWIISCACGSCEALWTRLGVSSPQSPFFLATHLLRRVKGVLLFFFYGKCHKSRWDLVFLGCAEHRSCCYLREVLCCIKIVPWDVLRHGVL